MAASCPWNLMNLSGALKLDYGIMAETTLQLNKVGSFGSFTIELFFLEA
jgi:hypothetical protein